MRKLNSILGDVWGEAHIQKYLNEKLRSEDAGHKFTSEGISRLYHQTVPIRYENIDLSRIDPFTLGFLKAALRKWPFYTVKDIEPLTIYETTADCVRFWFTERFWFDNRWADIFSELTPKNSGKALYYSSQFNSAKGFPSFITDPFDFIGNEVWDRLHVNAHIFLDRFHLQLNPDTEKLRGYNVP